MKTNNVVIGECYTVLVSGKVVPVRIYAARPSGGFRGRNIITGREITTRSAARLRTHIGDEASAHVWIALYS
jgi:hypothetical protein